MNNLTPRERAIWNAAITLAANVCAQRSDKHNADDETDEARAASRCAAIVSTWLDASDEQLSGMLIEANAPAAFAGLSAQALETIANKATSLAKDLHDTKPSYDLALAAGIIDKGYPTAANGYMHDYRGEAIIEMEDGSRWKAVGHGPSGGAISGYSGWIEFFPLSQGA